ncbi:rod shape-determining protein MreD [bacterium]|nr:MAG: rod shape-determining protein MreD [bacterium]
MKKWLLLAVVMALAVLQLSWPRFLVFFNARPDLLLVFVVAAVFYLDFKIALVFSIVCGLLKDAFLPADFGINTILFSLWCYAIWQLGRQISTEQTIVRFAVVFIAAFLNNIISGVQSANLGNFIPAGIFLRNLAVPSLYTAVLSPFIFKLTKNIAA